jgi:hypothetical protein
MAVSRILSASGANDFNLNITGPTTTASFDKEYASGSYSIVSSGNDATIDIYAYSANGTLVGYSATKAFTASGGFNKMVILGGTAGDVLGFTYKKTITTTTATAEVTAGPVITSISPSAITAVNDTITITGANFASNVAVTFTGTGYLATNAKSIVRSSSTSLIVTRPDNFPVSGNPYTVTVSNPGVANPVGSNVHISANSVSAGNTPTWTTGQTLPTFTRNIAYSTTLVAADADGNAITYSIVSGLPTGLSLNSSGVLSGTITDGGAKTGIVVRATDTGGNFLDRTFNIPNTGPVWVTTSQSPFGATGAAYSLTLVATDDSGVTPTFAVASGTLPTGLSLNTSTGVISGTPTVTATSAVVFSAADANGTLAANPPTITFQFRAATTFNLSSLPAQFVPGDVVNVGYTGAEQTFNRLNATIIDVALTGASSNSGGSESRGGGGGYVKGRLTCSQANYYLHIGGFGSINSAGTGTTGGYNGGGGFRDPGNPSWNIAAGSGASDFRTTSGAWNNATGLNNRILVAGGGGSGNRNGGSNSGGPGGYPNGLGSNSGSNGGGGTNGTGGTQSGGGDRGGYFGGASDYVGDNWLIGSGGGGWYGGGTGYSHMGQGAGGSSYFNSGVISNFIHTTGSYNTSHAVGSGQITIVAC